MNSPARDRVGRIGRNVNRKKMALISFYIRYPVNGVINHAKNNIYRMAVNIMMGMEIADNWIIKPMGPGRSL